jgi:hypothetical protein
MGCGLRAARSVGQSESQCNVGTRCTRRRTLIEKHLVILGRPQLNCRLQPLPIIVECCSTGGRQPQHG